jgi:hypothetical protein
MKNFYLRLLIFQTIIFGSLLIFPKSALTDTGKVVWVPLISISYTISVIFTFVIPMYKLRKK